MTSLPLLVTFQPSGPLATLATDEHGLVAVRAANGVGKTYTVMQKLARRATSVPGSHHRVVGPSRAQVREVTGRYLWWFLQPYVHKSSRWLPGTGWTRNGTVLLANGSEIQLSSYQDEPQVQEGRHDLDMIVLDEVPPRAHFEANKGRAKHQLIMPFTVQSRSAPDWLRREIEGGEESPIEGRTVHGTGWAQYVVPFSRDACFFLDDLEFQRKRALHLGTEAEGRRLNALWESSSDTRVLGGWSTRLKKSVAEIRRMLTGPDGRITGVIARYGIDHGSGLGKQCQYLVLYQQGRYYVVHEYVGGGNTTPTDNAQGMKRAIEAWLGPGVQGLQVLGMHRNGVRGDINSSGPAGAGEPLNAMMERALAALYNVDALPFRITPATKAQGYKELREVALNHAMLEHRFFVADTCPRFIRAAQEYEGGSRDPHKDPVDAVGYALEDLLMEHRVPTGQAIRR